MWLHCSKCPPAPMPFYWFRSPGWHFASLPFAWRRRQTHWVGIVITHAFRKLCDAFIALLCCIAFAQFCVLFSPYPVVSMPCATIAVITRAWHVYMGLFCHSKQPAGCQTANAFLSKMPIRNACNSRIKRPLAIWNQIDLCVCVFAGHISYT